MEVTKTSSAPLDVQMILDQETKNLPSIEVSKADTLTYDLGNLTAFDYTGLDKQKLANEKERENYLKEIAREDVQLMFKRLFNLPVTESVIAEAGVGVIVTLPKQSTVVPREKAPPKQEPKTKWEKFAAEKGIEKKRKRDRLEYDDNGVLRPRYGYGSEKNDEPWLIEEKTVPKINGSNPAAIRKGRKGLKGLGGNEMSATESQSQDPKAPYVDPYTKLRNEKKERVDKQKKQEKRNKYNATKTNEKSLPTTIELTTAVSKRKNKEDLEKALKVAQKATISQGNYDELLPDENRAKKKAKLIDSSNEKQANLKILDRVLSHTTESFDVGKAANRAITQTQQRRRDQKREGGFKGKRGKRQ